MTAEELEKSAKNDPILPNGLSLEEKVLWLARADQWDAAHDLCVEIKSFLGSWIHAWLHRKEGDLGNAAYWYSLAGKKLPEPHLSLEEEWFSIASELTRYS